MNEMLKPTSLHMPTDATFQAIVFSGIVSHPTN
jgi:hypothetical protein